MCGLVGIVASLPEDRVSSTLDSMISKVGHRGPDDQGKIVLRVGDFHLGAAHTRLSILDLSSLGHQPMGWGGERQAGSKYTAAVVRPRSSVTR